MPQHLLSSGQSFVLILIMPSSSRIMRRLISACWRKRAALLWPAHPKPARALPIAPLSSALPKLPSHRLDAVSRLLDIPGASPGGIGCASLREKILCTTFCAERACLFGGISKSQYRLIPGACGHAKSRPAPPYPLPADILEGWENYPCQMRISMKRALSFRGSFPGFPGRGHGKLSFEGGGVVLNHMASYADYLILGSARGTSAPQTSRQELRRAHLERKVMKFRCFPEEEFYSMIGPKSLPSLPFGISTF